MFTYEEINKNRKLYCDKSKEFLVRDFFKGKFENGWVDFYSQKGGTTIDVKFVKKHLRKRKGYFEYWHNSKNKIKKSGYNFIILLKEKDEIRLEKYNDKKASKRLKHIQKLFRKAEKINVK